MNLPNPPTRPQRQTALAGDSSSSTAVVKLSELQPGQQSDCFALLVSREKSSTRDGKPYYRTVFRDRQRSVTAMIWSDSAWFADCDSRWQVGAFYKLRCTFYENQYGPQIEIDRIREVHDEDRNDGFNPADFYQSTRFDVDEMFDELVAVAERHINDGPLKRLVCALLEENKERLKEIPAATRNHHAFTGGFLEHILSVTQTAAYLADKYQDDYPHLDPPLSKALVVAGAILHDIGKLLELDYRPQGSGYSAQGRLIGHIVLGRDLVREKAVALGGLDPETMLRLEHIIVSHQNLPEWGSPVAPHTPEALLVHYADDIDAKFQMMAQALAGSAPDDEEFTPRDNPLRRPIFRGLRSNSRRSDDGAK